MAGSAVSTTYGMKFAFHPGLDSSFMTLRVSKLARLKNLPQFGDLWRNPAQQKTSGNSYMLYGAHIISRYTR